MKFAYCLWCFPPEFSRFSIFSQVVWSFSDLFRAVRTSSDGFWQGKTILDTDAKNSGAHMIMTSIATTMTNTKPGSSLHAWFYDTRILFLSVKGGVLYSSNCPAPECIVSGLITPLNGIRNCFKKKTETYIIRIFRIFNHVDTWILFFSAIFGGSGC